MSKDVITINLYNKPSPSTYLMHHGIKGMKWGVRRTPEELGHKPKRIVEKAEIPGIIKVTVTGHQSTPKHAAPNSIADHIGKDGKVDARTYYDERGIKAKDIHITDHGNPNQHQTVPHVHEYSWNDDLSRSEKITRNLTDEERKENKDIL